jgi:hypothetical protein
MLTDADSEKISRGIAEDLEGNVMAERIGRCPSMVSRDIARDGGEPVIGPWSPAGWPRSTVADPRPTQGPST